MKKFLIRYTTRDGDYEKEWISAYSASEAEREFRDDHWNIQTIDSVEEIE